MELLLAQQGGDGGRRRKGGMKPRATGGINNAEEGDSVAVHSVYGSHSLKRQSKLSE